jgi:hypothetical protein
MSELREQNEARASVWWPRIVSAVLGIVVTVAGALIVQRLQAREPRLVYSSVETVPFNGPSNVVGIYQVVLRNDGKAEVENISCYIRVPGAKIEQYRTVAAASLSTSATQSVDAVRVDIPSLNPGESAQVSILASNPTYLPTHPEISVRAKGVTGEAQAPSGAPQSDFTWFYLSLAAAATALASTSLIRRLFSKGKGLFSAEMGVESETQAKTLASICRKHGLEPRALCYDAVKEITYYGEADRLGAEAGDSDDPQATLDVKKILLALSVAREMRDESRAIVFYNLARIAMKDGDLDEAGNYLFQARALSPEEVDGRRRIDPCSARCPRELWPNYPRRRADPLGGWMP